MCARYRLLKEIVMPPAQGATTIKKIVPAAKVATPVRKAAPPKNAVRASQKVGSSEGCPAGHHHAQANGRRVGGRP